MTLQDWSNLAQVVGAIAVVLSLFYVGFQIKSRADEILTAFVELEREVYSADPSLKSILP
jgi:hypothetical protein